MPNNKPIRRDEELEQNIRELDIFASIPGKGASTVFVNISGLMKIIKAYSLQEALRELSGVFGLMEDDVALWTQVDGDPFRLGERIAHLKKELEALK